MGRKDKGEVDLVRKVLWSNSCLCCLETGSSVHRSAVAAWSTGKHFTDKPAVQFDRVRIATAVIRPSRDSQTQPQHKSAGGTSRNTSSLLCLSQGSEDQWRLRTSSAQLAIPASQAQPLSLSVKFCSYPLNMGLSSALGSVSADITLPISPSPRKWQEKAAHPW